MRRGKHLADKPARCFLCAGAGRCVLWIAGYGLAARNLCEEFAPRNGAARVREERGANRALKKPAGTGRRRGIYVKNLLPGTEPQGLAGRGEQTAPWKKLAGTGRRRGICVKNLLPGTELQGLAERGEQTAPWKSRAALGVGAESV